MQATGSAYSTRRRVDSSTVQRIDASTRRRVDASTPRRIDAFTRRRVDALTSRRGGERCSVACISDRPLQRFAWQAKWKFFNIQTKVGSRHATYVRTYIRTYVRTYVRMYVRLRPKLLFIWFHIVMLALRCFPRSVLSAVHSWRTYVRTYLRM